MGGVHCLLGVGQERDHNAVAGPGRLSVMGRADIDFRLTALWAVARPAMVKKAALQVESAEYGVEEGQGGLGVQGA